MRNLVCLVFGMFLSAILSLGQPAHVKFMHLNNQGGLSGNSVYTIFQDSRNFIWIATDAGLNRFDGYDFKVYKSIFKDTNSLSNNNIQTIVEDTEKNLWIGTENGLNKFDRATETFRRFYSVLADSSTLSYNYITCLRFSPGGDLFVGTGGGGLCRYNEKAGNFTRTGFINKSGEELGTNISDMVFLPDGRLCLLINKYQFTIVDPENRVIDKITDLPNEKLSGYKKIFYYHNRVYMGADGKIFIYSLTDNSVKSIRFPSEYGKIRGFISGIDIDNRGIFWLGSTSNGLFLFDPIKEKVIENYDYHEYVPASLSGEDVSSVFIDKTGKVWVGTWGSGINYYHPDISKFDLLYNTQISSENLPGNKINAFCHDENKNVWIGTEQGVAKYQVTSDGLKRVPSVADNLPKSAVVSLFCDSKNNIWVCYFLEGIKLINAGTNTVKNIFILKPDLNVKAILETGPGNFWLATLGDGLIEYNLETGKYSRVWEGQLSSAYLTSILKDINNNIWIGTSFGLCRYNINTNSIQNYFHLQDDPSSIISNHIQCMRQLSDGQIIIGTPDGMDLFDKNTNSFTSITGKDALQDDYICGIEEDNLKRIWVSTLKGLSCMTIKSGNPLQYSVINYTGYDGIQTDGFRILSSIKLSSGMLLFGGNLGVNYFMPEKIVVDNSSPQAIVTDFQVNNMDIKINKKYDGHIILSKAITETKKIVLYHNENIISFDFAALNAVIPEKCDYKYKLDGFEQNWRITSSVRRRVSYNNLAPGEYTMKIKASNSDGVWGEDGVRLKIIIMPPIWKTKGAIGLYILLVFVSLFILRRIIIIRERKETVKKLAIQEAKQQHEMDSLKLKFFTNISHEFRTPLTLIITPVEQLLKDLKHKELEAPLQTVYRNSKRLLNLVNQLLDFRKMEVTGLKLAPSAGDIIGFIKEMVVSFADLAEKKHISFKFRSNINEVIMDFDHDKMEKIIFNLLSNAFKYTIEKGEILVEVDLIDQINLVSGSVAGGNGERREIQVKIKDTGIGISHDKMEHIFERFAQADKSDKIIEHGSGIGLSLTREFVKLHGGEIWATSEEGKGSTFIYSIPLKNVEIKKTQIDSRFSFERNYAREEDAQKDVNLPAILLVEDNEDLRFYLRDNFKQKYNIIEAGNGKTGVEKAIAEIPDLIISDIMMPELDGFELCKQLKNHQNTSHIPIILLTAKTSEEQQVAGFEEGADAYITKPFSFEILDMRVKNLIKQRKQLKSLFNKKIEINPSEISVTSVDEKLIRKALSVVEQNISNSEFSVEQLGRELGMSRVHLYKKLLSLTGKSPIEFIRVMRLKRAAQLLHKSQLRVSEIAYEVGFNNPKYFSKYFKEEFKMLPSEYAAKFASEGHDKPDSE